jgi:hypothetical protein
MFRPRRAFCRIAATSTQCRSCLYRPFSISLISRSEPLQSVLEDVLSPLEVTSVLRSGKGFKIRTLADPTPHAIHGNLILIDGECFLWRPRLQSPQPGVLDIAPESWGLLDVVAPKPGTHPLNRLTAEILVLGTGDRIMLVKRVRETMAKMGIQIDVQDSVFTLRISVDGRKMLRVCSIFYRLKGEVLRRHYWRRNLWKTYHECSKRTSGRVLLQKRRVNRIIGNELTETTKRSSGLRVQVKLALRA